VAVDITAIARANPAVSPHLSFFVFFSSSAHTEAPSPPWRRGVEESQLVIRIGRFPKDWSRFLSLLGLPSAANVAVADA